MLINLSLYAGVVRNGPNECRAVVDALRSRAEDIEQNEFADNMGDAAPTLQQLLHVSLLINEGFLRLSEQLESYVEPDGKGGYHSVYKPATTDTDNEAGEGRGV